MGEAARKLTSRHAVAARPQLRLVKSHVRPATKRNARSAHSKDAASAFRVFCVVMAALTIVGMLRITLAVQAQEAAIDANDLLAVIKAEEQVATALEADRSTLAAPSRIESIASSSLNMAQPDEVCYIDLPAVEAGDEPTVEPSAEKVAETGSAKSTTVASVISTVMDVAVGEAQVLLVGDVGIASVK